VAKLKDPLGNYCHGDCGVTWSCADDIYVCKDCIDVQFDNSYLDKLRAGELGSIVGSSQHEILHVPSFDPEKAKEVGKGRVRVGDEIIAISEWLGGIRRDWDSCCRCRDCSRLYGRRPGERNRCSESERYSEGRCQN